MYKQKIQLGHFELQSVSNLPGFDTVMGLQFENLVLNNRRLIIESLHVSPQDVVMDNPFYQRRTTRAPGCQIDYLIQTKFNSMFVCEIKFSRQELSVNVIREMKEKLIRLKLPRGFSCWPVLIHSSGVSNAVRESEYFTEIIDWSELI
jgi:uncharacterized protein